jgi:hypothetical protein
MEEVCYLYNV